MRLPCFPLPVGKLIEQQLLKESEIVAEDSMDVLKEFEALEDEM